MRKQFPFHFKRSDKEIKATWDGATFSFDANVLLHLYRYSPDTRSEFIDLLEKVSSRSWLSEQAAYEYLKNRPTVIASQIDSIKTASDELGKAKGNLKSQLKEENARSHPFYTPEAKRKFEEGVKALNDELNTSLKNLDQLYTDDPTRDRIADWFDGKTGTPLNEEDFQEACTIGEQRYGNKTPPGYEDADDKQDTSTDVAKRSRYGDWLIWKQLMEFAKVEQKDVVFVTDDVKEDWWLQKGDSKIYTPRPELLQEFYEETGQHVLIYSFLRFLKHGKKFLDFRVSEEATEEARSINVVKSAQANENVVGSDLMKETISSSLRSITSAATSAAFAGIAGYSNKSQEQLSDIERHLLEVIRWRTQVEKRITALLKEKAEIEQKMYNAKTKPDVEDLQVIYDSLQNDVYHLQLQRKSLDEEHDALVKLVR